MAMEMIKWCQQRAYYKDDEDGNDENDEDVDDDDGDGDSDGNGDDDDDSDSNDHLLPGKHLHNRQSNTARCF